MNKITKTQFLVGAVVLLILLNGIQFEWPGIANDEHFSLQIGSKSHGDFSANLGIVVAVLGFAYLSVKNEGKSFIEFLGSLTLSRDDCYIGGVCGGLARHSAIPSWVWRMLFAILFFGDGTGVLAYIVLWIFVPSAADHKEASAAS